MLPCNQPTWCRQKPQAAEKTVGNQATPERRLPDRGLVFNDAIVPLGTEGAFMNKLTLSTLGLCAGLAGCVGYVDPYGGYGQPGVYHAPGTVYGAPPVVVAPTPIVVGPPAYHHRGYSPHRARPGSRWDRDGDGVPNRYDARPRNPYRY
jgi:hypothetical protein